MIKILLFASLFMLFYSLIVGQFPKVKTIKDFCIRIVVPLAFSIGTFIFFSWFFMTPISGAFMAILGWQLPGWIREKVEARNLKFYRTHAKNFITSAGGLYSAGMVTSQVLRSMSERLPEPFASEFQSMVARRELDPTTSFPQMLNELANKYNLPEIKAEAAIIAAADNAGGPKAAARGSKRLGKALRLRDELIQDRIQATYQPRIASLIVLLILGIGLFLDATAWRQYFQDGGQLIIAFSVLLFVGITLLARLAVRIDDIR